MTKKNGNGNVVPFSQPRQTTETEARAALAMFMTALGYAKCMIADWANRGKKPTNDELVLALFALNEPFNVIGNVINGSPDSAINQIDATIADIRTRMDAIQI
jgi:hypothetical protein